MHISNQTIPIKKELNKKGMVLALADAVAEKKSFMEQHPIVIIEDDKDDQDFLTDIFQELRIRNKLSFFDRCMAALHYLKTTLEVPFLIICDINIPDMTGLEFKALLDRDHFLRAKAIPFIFFSTAGDYHTVNKAYTELSIQGYFQKKGTHEELKEIVASIVHYWRLCKHPRLWGP